LLKHRHQQPFIIFPDAETPLFNIFFISPHSQNIPVCHFPIILIPETTPSSTCFAFPLSVAETPLAATFPVAETLLSTTFHFLPVAETLLPATFHHCFDAETPRPHF
jgi:hypothetical protein